MGVIPTQVKGYIPEKPKEAEVKSMLVRGVKAGVKWTIAGLIIGAITPRIKPMLPELGQKAWDVIEPVVKGASTGEPVIALYGGLLGADRLIGTVSAMTGVDKVVKPAAVSGALSERAF